MNKLVKVNIQVKDGLDVDSVVSLLTATGAADLTVSGNSVTAVVKERLVGNLRGNSSVASLESSDVAELSDEPVKNNVVPVIPAVKSVPVREVVSDEDDHS